MSSCKCKNYMKTPRMAKKVPVESGYFQAAGSRHPYMWDLEKAWIPKTMAVFVATHQTTYGSANAGMSSSTANVHDVNAGVQRTTQTRDPEKRGGKIKVHRDGFTLEKTGVQMCYTSDLLPDIPVDEFTHLLFKCCIIVREPQKN